MKSLPEDYDENQDGNTDEPLEFPRFGRSKTPRSLCILLRS